MSDEMFSQAEKALEKGERGQARALLGRLLIQNPRNEAAWLLLARAVDQRAQAVECLERASQINPQNRQTAQALAALKHHQPSPAASLAAPPQPPKALAPSKPSATPQPAQLEKANPDLAATVVAPRTAEPMPADQVRPRKTTVKETTLIRSEEQMLKEHAPRGRTNWSLILGGIIVLLIAFAAILGPRLAPKDPVEENVIIKAGDTWVTPPFPAFTVPGFLLGSDLFGRDLLSRILWGIRPTIIMVFIVAVVRLVLGTIIGLGAGWSGSRLGRWLEMLITAALAVPVFMVALGAIAMLGATGGNLYFLAEALGAPEHILAALEDAGATLFDQMLPFIIGLSINGWGETARLVREQTRAVRGQPYIEASHALGASSFQILSRHVLKQILPMLWMLFSFEISSTLMVTAGLGFLGYYIGGDVWIEVGDFVSRRVSGTPELGQMLATSWSSLTEPWPMVLTGSIIFITVLGFNLLGDGLRTLTDPERASRNNWLARASHKASWWLEEKFTYPAGNWMRKNRLGTGLAAGALLITGVSLAWWFMRPPSQEIPTTLAVTIPGGHPWASERGDPYGTRWSNFKGPAAPSILWSRRSDAGFTGGAVISAQGIIYIGSADGHLFALNEAGDILWQVELPAIPTGSPALGAQGEIFIADLGGGLSAVSPDGTLTWHIQPEGNGKGITNPAVAADGTAYSLMVNPLGDRAFSVALDGKVNWETDTQTKAADSMPRLTPSWQDLFVKNSVLRTEDGAWQDLQPPSAQDPVLSGREQYFVGGDAQTYLLAGHLVMQWRPTDSGMEIVQTAEWNYESVGMNQYSSFPVDAGVTADKTVWLFYSRQYGGTFIVWLDLTGAFQGLSGTPLDKNSLLVTVDDQSTAYVCGISGEAESQWKSACYAYPKGSAEPSWEIDLSGMHGEVIGGAATPGRLYITTEDGYLFAIGDG